MNLLDHQKIMLDNICTHPELFKKELKKSNKWLKPKQYKHLLMWVKRRFGYSDFSKPLHSGKL